jgi:hypothetical protein
MEEETKKIEISDQVRLPIGLDINGVRYRNIVIDELTGVDDHLVSDKKNGNNASKASSKVLCRVIQEIEGVVPRKKNPSSMIEREFIQKMYGPDRDYIMARVYMLSGRDEIMLAGECPRCERVWEEKALLSEIPVVEWDDDHELELPFELPKGVFDEKTSEYQKKGFLKVPTGKIQEMSGELQGADSIDAILCACVKQLGTFPSLDRVRVMNMVSRDREVLLEMIQHDFPGLHPWKEVHCQCGRNFDIRADMTAFFGGRRKKEKNF